MSSSDWSSNYQTSAVGRDGNSNAEFHRLSQLIGSNIQKMSNNVNNIQRMIAQLGTATDSEQLRNKLHEIQHSTGVMAKDTTQYIKEFSNLPPPANANDQRQVKLQKERLVNDFSVVLNNFQSGQRNAAQKEKASVLRARANSGVEGNPFEDDTQAPVEPFRGAGSQGKVQLDLEQNLGIAAIQEREQAIRQLESDIMDVNQIFKDLAVMVHEQGEIVDSIEANVEHAHIHVEQAGRDIEKAHTFQEKARKKRYALIAIAVIVVLVLILLIYIIA